MQKLSRLDWITLAGIVLLAALLRLSLPGTSPFASDEARVSLLALEMAQAGIPVTQGISSSVGARNLPASIYAFVPPFLLSTDPVLAVLYVGLLNVLAIAGVWWLVRRTWGASAALVAALYLTLSPFQVFYSRSIWAQNLLLPLTVAWLLAVMRAIQTHLDNRRRLYQILAIALTGITPQIHLAGVALLPALAFVYVRHGWWRGGLRALIPLITGFILALIPALPFIQYGLCCAPELFSDYLRSAGDYTPQIDSQMAGYMLQLGIQADWEYRAPGSLIQADHPLLWLSTGILLLTGAITLLSRLVRPAPPESQTAEARHLPRYLMELALILLFAPILTFTYHRTPVHLHYALVGFVGLALLAGAATLLLKRPLYRRAVVALMLIIGTVWGLQVGDSLLRLTRQIAPDGMAMPLGVLQAVANQVPDDRPVVMHIDGTDPYFEGGPAIWSVLFWDREHLLAQGWQVLILPDEPVYLMTGVDGIHAYQTMQHTGLLDDRLWTIQPLPDVFPYPVQPYDGETAPQGFIMLDEAVAFESGLVLEGWQVQRVDHQVRLLTLYRVESLSPVLPVQQFAHLRTEAGLSREQPDAVGDSGLSAHSWRVGDRLIASAVFEPGALQPPFWFDVGHYPAGQPWRFSRLDGDGDSLRVGPWTESD